MDNYFTDNVYVPEWLLNFRCSGGLCEHTCCQGWNINVDEKHAQMYLQFSDSCFQPIIHTLMKKTPVLRKHKKSNQEYLFHLPDMPDGKCPLMNQQGLCSLQIKFGPNALCNTCFFFPRLMWQIDNNYSMSCSLSCPEVLKLAIKPENPGNFTWMRNPIDPELDWLETSLIKNISVRTILQNRQIIVDKCIQFLLDENDPIPYRIIKISNLFLNMDQINSDNEINKFPQTLLKNFSENKFKNRIPILLPNLDNKIEQVRLFRSVFDFGLENGMSSLNEANRTILQIISGSNDPEIILSKNLLMAEKEIYAPFIQSHPWLEKNLMVFCAFSEILKQFHTYDDENGVSLIDVLNYEAIQMPYIFALFRMIALKNCIISKSITIESFLQSIFEADNCYLHYPRYLKMGIERFPNVFSNPELISLLLL